MHLTPKAKELLSLLKQKQPFSLKEIETRLNVVSALSLITQLRQYYNIRDKWVNTLNKRKYKIYFI